MNESIMESGTCEICMVENGEVAASPHLTSLLLKHLRKKVVKDVSACGPCSQLLQLWNDFFDQAIVNLDITHPSNENVNQMLNAGIPDHVTSRLEDPSDETINVPDRKILEYETCSTLNNEIEAQAVLVGDVGCEDEEDCSVNNEFSDCMDDPLMALTPFSEQLESEVIQDPLQEDVKPNLALLNTGQLQMPYPCADCNKKFFFARGLNLHISLKHFKTNVEAKKENFFKPSMKNDTNKKTLDCVDKQIASIKEESYRKLRGRKTSLLCPKCNITLPSKQLLRSHLLEVCIQKLNDVFTCIYCTEEFKSKLSLNFHIRKHLDASVCSKCNHCEKTFTSSELLTSHVQAVHNVNLKRIKPALQTNFSTLRRQSRFPCSFCFQTFARKFDAERHIKNVHSNKVVENLGSGFKCTFCTKIYKTKEGLAKHLKIHKNLKNNCTSKQQSCSLPLPSNSELLFNCGICKARFSTDLDLKSHSCVHSDSIQSSSDISDHVKKEFDIDMNSKLNTNNIGVPLSLHQCKLCASVLKTKSGLREHTKKYHSNRNADNLSLKFQCKYCNNRFRTKKGLIRHNVGHKKVKIKISSMTNALNKKLTKNTVTGIAESVEKKSQKTINMNSLLEEKLIKHPESENLEIKKWACSICSLSFKMKHSLKLHFQKFHMRSNATEQKLKFKCKHCGNRFMNQSGLSSHILWQHTRQPTAKMNRNSKSDTKSANVKFPCEFCHETLTSQDLLDLHMVKEHLVKKSPEDGNSNNDQANVRIGNDRKIICIVCKKMFTTDTQLQSHLLIHMHTNYRRNTNCKQTYSCPYCKKRVLGNGALQSHIHHKHPNNFALKNKPGMKVNANNIKTRTAEISKKLVQFQCKYCLIKTNNKKNLDYHMKKHHSFENKNINNFLCKICCKNYPSSIQLSLHMSQHQQKVKSENKVSTSEDTSLKLSSVVNTNNLTCSFCLKHFGSLGTLNNHLRKLHGQTNIPCKYCCVMFISRASLTEHIIKSHLRNSRKKHLLLNHDGKNNAISCKYCNQSVNRNDLATHMKNLHTVNHIESSTITLTKQEQDTRCQKVSEKHYTLRDALYFCNFCMRSETSVGKITDHIIEEHFD